MKNTETAFEQQLELKKTPQSPAYRPTRMPR